MDFLISGIRFFDIKKYFFDIKNSISWYQEIEFLVSRNICYFLISRNRIHDTKKSNSWYQEFDFFYIKNSISWYQEMEFLISKIFLDIKKYYKRCVLYKRLLVNDCCKYLLSIYIMLYQCIFTCPLLGPNWSMKYLVSCYFYNPTIENSISYGSLLVLRNYIYRVMINVHVWVWCDTWRTSNYKTSD